LFISGVAVFDYLEKNETNLAKDSTESFSSFEQNAYAMKNKLYTPKNQFQFMIVSRTVSYTDESGQTRDINIAIRTPIGADGPQPVVIWMHGGTEGSTTPVSSLKNLNVMTAKAGYVSVSIAHPVRSLMEQEGLCNYLQVLNDPVDCEAFQHLAWDRPHDLSAVIDYLEQLPTPWDTMLDLDNIAVGGHSNGAGAALVIAGAQRVYYPLVPSGPDITTIIGPEDFSDPRPKVFLAFSSHGPLKPGFFDSGFNQPESSWSNISRPVLTATGDGDSSCASPIKVCLTGETPYTRKISHQRMPDNGNKFLFYINDSSAAHNIFILNTEKCETVSPVDKCNLFVDWLSSSSVAFLDAFLRGEPKAEQWLKSDRIEQASQNIVEWDRR